MVGWVLWQFEGNPTHACKYHFLRIRLRLVWVTKMDIETKHSTISGTVTEGGSTTISFWKSLVGWVLWQIDVNQTPAYKYHFLRIRLSLVWVAKLDLEKKLSKIWSTIIEGGSTTIFSWKSLVCWVLWQMEVNQTPGRKYHFLRLRLRLVWVVMMDPKKKLSKIWRTIIEGGSITICSWKSVVGWVLWQFEANRTPTCKYHFLRTRLRLVWVAKMDLEKKCSTIWRTIPEKVPQPFLFESHWWVEFYGRLKWIKLQHVTPFLEEKSKIGLSGYDGTWNKT